MQSNQFSLTCHLGISEAFWFGMWPGGESVWRSVSMSKSIRLQYIGVAVVILIFVLSLPALASIISTKQEIKIGRSSSQQIEKQYGLVQDPQLNRTIDALGQRLASHGGRGIPYSFKVLNQDNVNAFAFPGGFVYVTKGICKAMTVDQLSFVVGHEITHVERRHSVKALERSMAAQVGSSILMNFVKGNKNNVSTLVGMTNFVISNRYSQSQEREADEGGTDLMAQAGFDPAFAVDALNVLKKSDNGKGDSQFMNSLLSTHPLTSERIEAAKGRVEGLRKAYKITPGSSAAKELTASTAQ